MNPPTPSTATPSSHEPLLTPDEVAAILRINPRAVVRMVRLGRLAGIPIDGRGTIRIEPAAFRKYLAENRIDTTAA